VRKHYFKDKEGEAEAPVEGVDDKKLKFYKELFA